MTGGHVAERTRGYGVATPRLEARSKVTGQARYGSDFDGGREPAHARLVTSGIALGRIIRIEEAAARAVPGVLEILTWRNVGDRVKPGTGFGAGGSMRSIMAPLASDRILYDGQIVAMVVADTFEGACEAASVLRVTYAEETPSATFGNPGLTRGPANPGPGPGSLGMPRIGDAEASLRDLLREDLRRRLWTP
jgi:xanthine dehydrogenase YagR molybdenum-binding subunit